VKRGFKSAAEQIAQETRAELDLGPSERLDALSLAGHLAIPVDLQERRLDRTVLRTYRTKLDLDELIPNPNQPRLGPKVDAELQRQIEANEGIFEPLLVEPHPELKGKYRQDALRRRAAESLDLYSPSAQGMGRSRKGDGRASFG